MLTIKDVAKNAEKKIEKLTRPCGFPAFHPAGGQRRHYMILRYIFTYFILLFILALTGLLMGCAQNRPLAQNPPLYAQDKLQSADHWDNVADTVALRIQKSLEDRRDLINKPLYVQPPNDRPFSLAFFNLLRTRLVSKGMQVVEKKEADCLEVRYEVQTILHEDTAEWAPSLAAMGIGVANFVTGKYASLSEHEIIINTSMVHNNRFVMHLSTICYINDREWPMYMNAGGYASGGAAASGAGPLVASGGGADPLWQRYASRGQAFANCDQPAASKTAAKAPPSSVRKKSSGSKSAKKAPAKTTAPAKTPPSASNLFPEPICPDGCIPAPKPATAGVSERAVTPAPLPMPQAAGGDALVKQSAPVTPPAAPANAGTPAPVAPVPSASAGTM